MLHDEVGPTFEMIYVGDDKDEQLFNRYYGSMAWCGLPYAERAQQRHGLWARFGVTSIPSVVMLRRNVRAAEGWSVVCSGRDGVRKLSEVISKPKLPELVEELKRNLDGQAGVMELNGSVFDRLKGRLSLVVLCEHLSAGQSAYKRLAAALEDVAQAYSARCEDANAAERPPRMQFFLAAGPSNLSTQWLRDQAGLPAVTTSAETLEVLLADLGQHSRTFHSMRAMAKVEGWSIDSTSLCAESGKLVMKFIELSVESRGPL